MLCKTIRTEVKNGHYTVEGSIQEFFLFSIDVPESHILRCHHPNTNYCGEETKQTFGDRLSLVVPLGRATYENGLSSESIGLEFLCQSSCATGINRKPAAVVFTLENERYGFSIDFHFYSVIWNWFFFSLI